MSDVEPTVILSDGRQAYEALVWWIEDLIRKGHAVEVIDDRVFVTPPPASPDLLGLLDDQADDVRQVLADLLDPPVVH